MRKTIQLGSSVSLLLERSQAGDVRSLLHEAAALGLVEELASLDDGPFLESIKRAGYAALKRELTEQRTDAVATYLAQKIGNPRVKGIPLPLGGIVRWSIDKIMPDMFLEIVRRVLFKLPIPPAEIKKT